jgi:hypothetical protein
MWVSIVVRTTLHHFGEGYGTRQIDGFAAKTSGEAWSLSL